jgi:hypothetical protein
VRDRYLVGMLAPKRQELSPEEFDELPQGGSGPAEDGPTEATSPSAKTTFPSSFGLTFCVDLDAKELQLTVRWGHYDPAGARVCVDLAADLFRRTL